MISSTPTLNTLPTRGTLRLTFPGRADQVGPVRQAVASHLTALAWPEDDIDGIILALGEACNNAVSYGRIGSVGSLVTVVVRQCGPREVEVEVRNPGGHFDPDLNRLRTLPGDESTHGRGFALMDALMDEVQAFSEGGETVIRLIKQRSS